MSIDGSNGKRSKRLEFLWAAIRSGLRRYPRTLVDSLRDQEARQHRPKTASLEHIEEHATAASWLGHATVLARLGGANLLVDPVFSHRIGMRLGRITLGPGRLTHVPVSPNGLPPVDLVLITHAHFDHLDKPTLRRIASKRTTVVTAPGTRRLVPRGFGAVHELGDGEALSLHGVQITALETEHWGARKVIDRHRGWNSYLVESPDARILFAGDTAMTAAFDDLPQVDLAVFGVGAYDPWEHMHATPEQVWTMFRRLGAKWLLPIHHSTFELSDEPVKEPIERLLAAADGHAGRIVRVGPGEIWASPDRLC